MGVGLGRTAGTAFGRTGGFARGAFAAASSGFAGLTCGAGFHEMGVKFFVRTGRVACGALLASGNFAGVDCAAFPVGWVCAFGQSGAAWGGFAVTGTCGSFAATGASAFAGVCGAVPSHEMGVMFFVRTGACGALAATGRVACGALAATGVSWAFAADGCGGFTPHEMGVGVGRTGGLGGAAGTGAGSVAGAGGGAWLAAEASNVAGVVCIGAALLHAAIVCGCAVVACCNLL